MRSGRFQKIGVEVIKNNITGIERSSDIYINSGHVNFVRFFSLINFLYLLNNCVTPYENELVYNLSFQKSGKIRCYRSRYYLNSLSNRH